jgi:hypothetical protein
MRKGCTARVAFLRKAIRFADSPQRTAQIQRCEFKVFRAHPAGPSRPGFPRFCEEIPMTRRIDFMEADWLPHSHVREVFLA